MSRGPAGAGIAARAPSRRTVLRLGAGAAMLPLAGRVAFAQTAASTDGSQAAAPAADVSQAAAPAADGFRHGMSVFGDLKYPADFTHFDWVVPDAPKGGRMAFGVPSWNFNQSPQTFNTLNTFVLDGDAPPRMEMCFASLMTSSLDEPDSMYGLLAESVKIEADTATFRIRAGARFHDGSPITAADAAFSIMTLRADGHPYLAEPLREVVGAEAQDELTLVVRFSGKQSRQLPLIVASLPILSKAYYTATDFKASTLTPPVGSGPYKVGRLSAGRYIEYERVADWWGQDLPSCRGLYNFDVIRIDFYRERTAAFEALKKGDTSYREEHVSRTWATEYNFPAVQEGKVVKRSVPDLTPSGMQGYFLNMRRPQFADVRTRQAIGLAFDFEWSNKALFYDLYQRTQSVFQNSQMMAEGEPGPDELALLEPFRAELDPAVFGPAILEPVSDGSGQDRARLRRASQLLAEAGWTRQNGRLADASDRRLTIEFLDSDNSGSRIVQPFIRNLDLLGIDAAERLVDPAQYQRRLDDFDFDVVSARFSLGATPDDAIRTFFTSGAARQPGSRNLSGIASPVVDALVETMIAADSRAAMDTAARALDRVLRSMRPWVPGWYNPAHNIAYWDVFGYPPEPPRYGFPVETTWWYDEAKASALGR